RCTCSSSSAFLHPSAAGARPAGAWPRPSEDGAHAMTIRSSPTSLEPFGPAVLRRLIGAYLVASVVATVGGAALFGFGLDFTPRQVAIGLLVLAPLAVLVATGLDVWVLRAAFRPVDAFLRGLPSAERCPPDTAVAALVRAINLPVLTLLRVLSV